MAEEKRCEHSKWVGFGSPRKQCTRKAVVEREGTHYCWQHDPEKVKERRDKAFAKAEEKIGRKVAQWRLEAAAPELLECLIELTAAAEAADCGSRELLERCRKAIAQAKGDE